METKMKQYNSAPLDKESEVLRQLLSQQRDELVAAENSIASKESEVSELKRSIDKLQDSVEMSCASLEIHERHRAHLAATYHELSVLFSQRPSSWGKSTSLAVSIEKEIHSRIQRCKSEEESASGCVKELRLMIKTLQEDIRSQRYRIAVIEMNFQASVISRDCILEAIQAIQGYFRPIKRVPDEIWLQILEIAIKEATEALTFDHDNLLTLSAAIPFSHVCITWRRVLLACPKIWSRLHASASVTKPPRQRRKLLKILIRRADGLPVHFVTKRQYGAQTTSWWPIGFDINTVSQSDGTCHLLLSSVHPIIPDLGRLLDAVPKAVIIEAKRPEDNAALSEHLIQDIWRIKTLTLINVMPRLPQPIVSESLKHLQIEFSAPAAATESGAVPYRYDLFPLISDSLESLGLSHYDSSMVYWQGGAVVLLHLHTLSISPNEHHLVENLVVPSLQHLTISIPLGPSSLPRAMWIEKFSTLCKNISHLTLDWVDPFLLSTDVTIQDDMVPIFIAIWSHAPKLKSLTFVNGFLDGLALCDYLSKSAVEATKTLTDITIKGCFGVSREDCDRLTPLVGTLNVFRTFHLAT